MRTVGDVVDQLDATGERTALLAVADGRATPVSARDLASNARRLARGLIDAGVRPGEPVVLIGPNGIGWITVRLAVALCGAVAVALDDQVSDRDLAAILGDCGAHWVFAGAAERARIAAIGAPEDTQLVALEPNADPAEAPALSWRGLCSAPSDGDGATALPTLAPDTEQMQVYTSGTTGAPKSFFLTHANVLFNVRALLDSRVVMPDDRVLLPLPLHHVYPLTIGLLTPLAAGATVVLPEAIAGPQIADAIRIARVTVMVGVPRLYNALVSGIVARAAARGALARRLFHTLLALSLVARRRFGLRLGRILFASLHRRLSPGFWLMASGGAKLDSDTIWRLEALGWDVRTGWGLAETSSILTCNGGGADNRIGSEGRVLSGMAVRVAEPDEDGVGELEARGPSLFQGYDNNPDANAAAFTEDGWFRTGDLGRIDADGFVFIVGRSKEMIVLGGGKNVFPEALEKAYGASPLIQELGILEHQGALVALVVPDLEAAHAEGRVNVDDAIRVWLTETAQTRASYQRLAGYALTAEPLPKTRLGKLRRFLLPALYQQARAGRPQRGAVPASALPAADRALLDTAPAAAVYDWLGQRYPNRPVAMDASLALDLGIDSLEWVTLSVELAERFDIHLAEDDAAALTTVRDLIACLPERLGRPAERPTGALAATPQPALTADELAWLASAAPHHRLAGRLGFRLDQALIHGVFGLEVTGADRLPETGPLIVAPNHLSDLDPLVVGAALGPARFAETWWAGDYDRVFGSAAGRFLARSARVFPVTEATPAKTLAYGSAVLARRQILVWFPEAWRSPDGRLQRFLPGLGHLVQRSGAAVVPTLITGTFGAMPRGRTLPRPRRLGVTFGAPLAAAGLIGDAGRSDPVVIAERVRDAVAALAASEPGGA